MALTLEQAQSMAKNAINNVLGNARTQQALKKGEGYSLKFEQRGSTNGGTYFNIIVVDNDGNKVGSAVQVGNYNPSRTRAWFGLYENIIVRDIERAICDDIVRKLCPSEPVAEVTFEVFEAPAVQPAQTPKVNVSF